MQPFSIGPRFISVKARQGFVFVWLRSLRGAVTRSWAVPGFVRWPLSSLLQNPFRPPQMGNPGYHSSNGARTLKWQGSTSPSMSLFRGPSGIPEQQRMLPFPQLPTSAANSTWLRQHVPFPAKGQLMTSLLLAHRVPVQRVPPVQTPRRHCQCWRHGSPSPRPFLRGRGLAAFQLRQQRERIKHGRLATAKPRDRLPAAFFGVLRQRAPARRRSRLRSCIRRRRRA